MSKKTILGLLKDAEENGFFGMTLSQRAEALHREFIIKQQKVLKDAVAEIDSIEEATDHKLLVWWLINLSTPDISARRHTDEESKLYWDFKKWLDGHIERPYYNIFDPDSYKGTMSRDLDAFMKAWWNYREAVLPIRSLLERQATVNPST